MADPQSPPLRRPQRRRFFLVKTSGGETGIYVDQRSTSTNASSPYGLVTALLAQSPDDCTHTGGGCAVLVETLTACSSGDDTCACAISLAAQVCTQCDNTKDAITIYDNYLQACVDSGLANPSGTLTVSLPGASSNAGNPSGSSAGSSSSGVGGVSSVVNNSSMSTNAPSSSLSSATGPPINLAIPSTPSTSLMTITSTMSASSSAFQDPSILAAGNLTGNSSSSSVALDVEATFQSVGPSTTSSLTSSSSSSSSLSPSSSDTSSLVTSTNVNSSALEAAMSFFDSTIPPNCSCDPWQSQSKSCSDDSCICTSSILASARTCSECVQSAGAAPGQMRFYSAFTNNCTIEFPNLSNVPGPSSSLSAALGFQTSNSNSTNSTSSLSSSISSPSNASSTPARADAAMAATTKSSSSAPQLVRREGLVGVVVILASIAGMGIIL
ncbi:hypothetical protein TREMEDRAFT_59274 [Tremella mesenterica DSM 1558]|uniref:uncharacterized protein n=1 Tax=Tremella mesenterica (strain ATCC 24925 / CBS 8224 / DSM 1558 / NBRC 9311 / NRRL Y-6157 / RJB 2259-6 / UBC 559-6) TaxID=578456 RepID=UPI0003F4927D|nr:uncharacterized protein TREMEDRAFT_59274 [Tremella mesenterica DSM 1558]EIW73113.1 hypothetical protein TREMEDRAFT_59274 [Tremella mesenterica DSM 1558]